MKSGLRFSEWDGWLCPRSMVLASCMALVGYGLAAPESVTEGARSTAPVTAEQLAQLRERQDLLVEASARNLNNMQFTLAIVGGVFSFLTIMLVIRQFQEQNRRHKVEEQNASEGKDMMASFRANIDMINALIATLKDSFDFQKDFKDKLKTIDNQINTLDEFKKREDVSFISRVDSLNALAANTFTRCEFQRRDREAFKREENRIALQSVASLYTMLGQTGNLENLASPVVIFLRAMSRFNGMEYEDAIKDLMEARAGARVRIDSPVNQYGTWDAKEAEAHLGVLSDEICYHLGIIYYNVGKYEEARMEFDAAFQRNPLDFRSRIYIPELLFFDDRSDPRRVDAEFHAVEQDLNNVAAADRGRMNPSWNGHYAALKMRQGNLYLPKDFRPPSRLSWERFERQQEAIDCFGAAMEKAGDSAFVKFSLAQAISRLANPWWKDRSAADLYREVFYSFRNDAVVKTEPILLTTLYYCAAISCFHANIHGEAPSVYLTQARQHLRRVPKNIRVFSPLNKINLTHQEILDEMKQLELWWQSK